MLCFGRYSTAKAFSVGILSLKKWVWKTKTLKTRSVFYLWLTDLLTVGCLISSTVHAKGIVPRLAVLLLGGVVSLGYKPSCALGKWTQSMWWEFLPSVVFPRQLSSVSLEGPCTQCTIVQVLWLVKSSLCDRVSILCWSWMNFRLCLTGNFVTPNQTTLNEWRS